MKLKLASIIFLFISLSFKVSAQNGIVRTEPTLEDRFPKRIGGLRFSQTTLHLGDVYNNANRMDTIQLYNNSDAPLTLSISSKLPDQIKASIEPSKLEPASEGIIVVQYDATKQKEFGFNFDRIILHTNDTEMPEKNINITLSIKEYFPPADPGDTLIAQKARLAESTYNFGRLQQGEKARHDYIIFNDGQRDLKIHHAKNTCGCIKTSFSKNIIAPGDSALASIEFDSFGKDGSTSNESVIFVNDPSQPELRLIIQGDVWK